MKPTSARLFANFTLAFAATVVVAAALLQASPAAADASSQLQISANTRCRTDLAVGTRRYFDRVLFARLHCESRVVSRALPASTDCIHGRGDAKLDKALRKAEDKLSNIGRACGGVNLTLLGFPGICTDTTGAPFDTGDYGKCVLTKTDEIVGRLFELYYPPLGDLFRGSKATCLRGSPLDAAGSLRRILRSRMACLLGQEAGIYNSSVGCRNEIAPYGSGTGNASVDSDVSRAYVTLLGRIPQACADIQLNDLNYQSSCPDETGGLFTVFDLKQCFFKADRAEALNVLAIPFPTDPVCGNASVEGNEQCDLGINVNSDTAPNTCRTNCKNPSCHDGVKDDQFSEGCDDGNTVDKDGCSGECVTDTCGDAVINISSGKLEECDDGTTLNSNSVKDACRTNCKNHFCGDGVPDTGELCDDGNTVSGDGCNSICITEECGDEVVQAGLGEQCDNGEDNSDTVKDACRTNCKNPKCTDGVVDTGESCDDGNTNNDDSCNNFCAECGNGVKEAGEECDTGVNNANAPNKCRLNCKNPKCGDSITDSGEGCDDGNSVNTDTCTNICTFCGNNLKETGEACDGSDVATCGAGQGCNSKCSCEDACPAIGQLVLYAGVGDNCTTNTDCTVGTCQDGKCHTLTRLDSGWTGLAHDADINDGILTQGKLSCSSRGDVCGECDVTGVDPSIRECRCSNDTRTICTDPFNTDAAQCPACAGGPFPGLPCSANSDCIATGACAKRCTNNPAKVCSTNTDCPGSTCPATATTCSTATSCTTNGDCVGTCTDKATCDCYFGAPFPLSSGGTPACVVNRFSENISGKANVDLGAGQITAKLRTRVYLGISTTNPCPTCGGTCSNDSTLLCDRDLDCDGGTCNLDPTPDDGLRGGVCIDGQHAGLGCDVNGRNTSFPAFTEEPNGGGYSLDCIPDVGKNISGSGLIINLTQTTGTASLTANVSCGGQNPDLNCPCLQCSGDTSIPCNKDSDCAGQFGSCDLSSNSECTTNEDCANADVGPCKKVGAQNRCTNLLTKLCSSNTDCFLNAAPCNPSTCSSAGSDSANLPSPNECDDGLCEDLGGGLGQCTIGPDSFFCDGVVKGNGTGILSCGQNADCAAGAIGVDAGNCTLVARRPCFLDPIVAIGKADPNKPTGAAVFCVPPTGNGPINSVAGLPGPGRILNQSQAKTFCKNHPTQVYIPGVGGCVTD